MDGSFAEQLQSIVLPRMASFAAIRAEGKPSFIELVDESMFDPLKPDPDLMNFDVIGTALSNSCRFGGQIRKFYSVAQHSVFVAALAPQDLPAQRMALLHDAEEGFGLPDLVTPVKPSMPQYVKAQARIGDSVFLRFALNPDDHARIKPADRQALIGEKMVLKGRKNVDYWKVWSKDVVAPDWIAIDPLQPADALELYNDAVERVFVDGLPIDRDWVLAQRGFVKFEPSSYPDCDTSVP